MLHIPKVSVSFIYKLVTLEKNSSHIDQDPVLTRGDPDIKKAVISDDGYEPLGTPEDIDGVEKTPTRVQ